MSKTENAKQIARLCAFWPHPAIEAPTMAAYGEAALPQHPDDVRRAVDDFIFGRVPGRSAEFIPPPGALAARIIVRRNERLDEEQRNKPRLPPPDSRRDAEAESRKGLIDRLKAQNGGTLLKPMKPDEQLERDKLRKAQEAIILAAFEGDEEAIAAWRAENMARGVAARAAVEGLPASERKAA
jgi:hypothetical protein